MTRLANRSLLRGFLLPACTAILGAAAACSPGYVLRAGWEEARILGSRRPIREVVHDTTAPAEVRAKLRLVQDSRDFARQALGLDPGESYRSYAEVTSDTLLLVVTAAEEFALRWKTWWFPIVGRVPYRGYFDFGKALEEGRRLERQGYDVSVRPTSAFSTLGWLPDPLLSTTLALDSVSLVETVVHEITHTTFFPAGQAHFNESFANFVGNRGAVTFFCDAVRDERLCERARRRWEDTRTFGRFFRSILEPLEELYAQELPPPEMRRRKRDVFEKAAERFRDQVRPRLRAGRYGTLDPESLNNAWILSRLLYYTRLDDFEAVYRRSGDLRSAVRMILEKAAAGDPWRALDELQRADDATAAPEKG
ncbi:MAG: aminopeptidase [Gemmatimonadota bacterium]